MIDDHRVVNFSFYSRKAATLSIYVRELGGGRSMARRLIDESVVLCHNKHSLHSQRVCMRYNQEQLYTCRYCLSAVRRKTAS
jgi:hypothetical protein